MAGAGQREATAPGAAGANRRLRSLARGAAAARQQQAVAELETCDLCAEPIPPDHRHLLDLDSRELLCACQACRLLFDKPAAGGRHYTLVPQRRLALTDFALDDAAWARLRIPVEMAFFFRSGEAGRVQAFYPGPMGATESQLALDSWIELERANPVLRTLEPDVEALLINRAFDARDSYLVPIEDPYRLAGLIRTRWRGLSGGREVWREIEQFFAELAERATPTATEEDPTCRPSV